jgi:hypothetical protein
VARSFLNIAGYPLGLRNNNPGNLVTGINWQGLIGSNGRFCVFENIAWGIRALATDLRTDINQGQNTIAAIITEFAPPSENNTAAYIAAVAGYTGINAYSPLTADRTTLKRLVRAIMNAELGQNYSAIVTDAEINEGIDLMSGTIPPGVATVGFGVSALVLAGAIYLLYTMKNP